MLTKRASPLPHTTGANHLNCSTLLKTRIQRHRKAKQHRASSAPHSSAALARASARDDDGHSSAQAEDIGSLLSSAVWKHPPGLSSADALTLSLTSLSPSLPNDPTPRAGGLLSSAALRRKADEANQMAATAEQTSHETFESRLGRVLLNKVWPYAQSLSDASLTLTLPRTLPLTLTSPSP